MSNKYKILIVEDENNIRTFISALLEANGYKTVTADTCAEAETMFASHFPDLVILDLGLPDKDGSEFLKNVRKTYSVPVIVLSARDGEADKVAALDAGANDYVTKPFGSAELSARVRSALRNSRNIPEHRVPNAKFVAGDLVIDYEARRVLLKDAEIKLTQTEYNIVAFLAENAGRMMTYAAIIKAVWREYPDEANVKKLQVNMANVRKKLGVSVGEKNYVTNELGVGYRMDCGNAK